jgi:hypothetical protein
MPSAHVVTGGGNICDFCTCIPVFKFYRSRTFALRGISVFNKGEGLLAACWKCSDFVDSENWSALIERAFQVFIQKHGVPRHEAIEARTQFAEMVRLFAAHRLGET